MSPYAEHTLFRQPVPLESSAAHGHRERKRDNRRVVAGIYIMTNVAETRMFSSSQKRRYEHDKQCMWNACVCTRGIFNSRALTDNEGIDVLLVTGYDGGLEFLEREAGNLVGVKLVSERLFEMGGERSSERASEQESTSKH